MDFNVNNYNKRDGMDEVLASGVKYNKYAVQELYVVKSPRYIWGKVYIPSTSDANLQISTFKF